MTDQIISQRVAVIGAGPSGLAAIKSCKEEGLDVTCYEMTTSLGGKWCYRDNSIKGVASIMKSTICVTSKEVTAYSDFPPPEEFPNYLHHKKILEYLKLYAEKFDLLPSIRFQQEVISVYPVENDANKKWIVKSLDKTQLSENSEEFDCVMVCTGRTAHPFMPFFVNLDRFSGKVLHSHYVKNPMDFEDKKVLVVGSGNSAVETAVEISTLANQVYLSTRSGSWIFPKIGPKGCPFDMVYLRRHLHSLKKLCNNSVNSHIEKFLDTKINHDSYKLKPNLRALDKHPTVNDALPDKILTGRVIIKNAIAEFTEKGVFFDYEKEMTEIDVVIFATGYQIKFPFLDEKLYKTTEKRLNLYKKVFPREYDTYSATLAFIGLVESHGSPIPVAEIQCRWAARVFSKKNKLPAIESHQEQPKLALTTFAESSPSALLEVDHIQYMDEIAEEFGAKPNMAALLFKDPILYSACFMGPFLSYQYRLFGPHNWSGAREAILKCQERVSAALSIIPALKKQELIQSQLIPELAV